MSTQSIRIDLTNDQKEQLRRQSGHAIEAIELEVQELEARLAPTDAVPFFKVTMQDATITHINLSGSGS